MKIHSLTLNLVSRSHEMLPLHYVTYAPAKSEVATSSNLGRGAFTKKNTLFDLWP